MRYVVSGARSICWTIGGSDGKARLVMIDGCLFDPSSTSNVMVQGAAGAYPTWTNRLPAVAPHWRQNRVTEMIVACFTVAYTYVGIDMETSR